MHRCRVRKSSLDYIQLIVTKSVSIQSFANEQLLTIISNEKTFIGDFLRKLPNISIRRLLRSF